MLNVIPYGKEGDIGFIIAITLNIRFRTSLTKTSGFYMLVYQSSRKRGCIKLPQDYLHITRDNDMINIESYGWLTLSPIAFDIHKTEGLPHQLNVIVRYIFYTIQ